MQVQGTFVVAHQYDELAGVSDRAGKTGKISQRMPTKQRHQRNKLPQM